MRINKTKRERERLINNISNQILLANDHWAIDKLLAFHNIKWAGYCAFTYNGNRYRSRYYIGTHRTKPEAYVVLRYYDFFQCYCRQAIEIHDAILRYEFQVIDPPGRLSEEGIPVNAPRRPEMELAV